MKTAELPIFDFGARAFVFGGAYGNYQATKAVLAQAKDLGFEKSQIVSTGDTVAYCAEPQATVDLIQEHEIISIMGNCEESLALSLNDCGCGFEEGSACDLLSAQWFSFCQNNLDAAAIGWMSELPKTIVLKIGAFKLQCVHASPNSINQFVFNSTLASNDFSLHSNTSIDGYIAGHSGIPLLAEIEGKAWINSGAVGMPANDGTPRTWYATIEARQDKLRVTTHALEYDWKSAQSAMQAHGLDNGYAKCLKTGIWPSHDVLPQEERKQTGVALNSKSRTYSKFQPNVSAVA